jgi:hypothetical protein
LRFLGTHNVRKGKEKHEGRNRKEDELARYKTIDHRSSRNGSHSELVRIAWHEEL